MLEGLCRFQRPQESLGPNHSAGSRRGLTQLQPDSAERPKPREVSPCLPSSINLSKAESGQRRPTSSPLPRRPGLPMLTSFQRGAWVCKSQGITSSSTKVKVKSLPSPAVLRRIMLVVTLGFLTHKLTTPLRPLRTQVHATGFLSLRREKYTPAGEPLATHTQLSQGLGDSQLWQTLKTFLPLGYNNSVKDLALRNSWGWNEWGGGGLWKAGNVSQWEEPESRGSSPAGASQPVTHEETSLLNPAWTPGPGPLCLSTSSCLQSAQTPEQRRSLESPAKTQGLCIYSGVICGSSYSENKKITSLPSEELGELLGEPTLTTWDWNLGYHFLKKRKVDIVHFFSLIHNKNR